MEGPEIKAVEALLTMVRSENEPCASRPVVSPSRRMVPSPPILTMIR